MTRTAKLAAMAVVALAAFAPVASKASPFKDIQVDGMASKGVVHGTLDLYGFFQQDGQLWASGVLAGTINDVPVSTPARVPMTGGTDPTGSVGPACWTIHLNAAVIYLDLLETQVDAKPIAIVIDAHQMPDYHLAGLICAAGGLLDEVSMPGQNVPGKGKGVLSNFLNQLVTLLNQIACLP